jgi:hypothetical protein
MCPCISSRSTYATCGRSSESLMVPSLFERAHYCFGLYELCPLFAGILLREGEFGEAALEPVLSDA